MKIQALKPFTMVDATTGKMTSIACGSIAVMDDAVGAQLISDGLAVEYTLISPTGSKSITENDTYDVTQYAEAVVNVPNPSTGELSITENGTYDVTAKASVVVNVGTYTITYDANGGTGSVSAQTVIAGNEASLSDGTGLVAPEGKQFGGWATTSTAEASDVSSPYKPTANVTLYAYWTTV